MERNNKQTLTRRQFLQIAGLTGGAVALTACGLDPNKINAGEPDPEVVAKRVQELLAEKKKQITQEQFNRVETGIYNPEALAKWKEIEQQPKIDERIGICIEPSRYVRGTGSIEWHAKVAELLGFQKVAIPISPPEFVGHTGITDADTSSLDKLLQYPEFDAVFSNPAFKAVHITADIGGGGANAWQLPDAGAFSQDRLQKTHDEAFAAANFILEKWGNSGKQITLSFSNEIELHAKGGYSGSTEDQNISQIALDNGIKYFNTVFKAIRDANNAHPDKTALLTGMEVLQIRTEFEEGKNAITGLDIASGLDVLPDELTLSAWQFSGKGDGGYWTQKAIEKMNEEVWTNTSITEYGVAYSDRTDLSKDAIAAYYTKDIQGAISAGAQHVYVWGLTCFNSKGDKNFPNNDEIRGLGLVRPDGTMRKEVYRSLQEFKA